MVTFESWIVSSFKKSCGFLNIVKNGLIYTIPYDRGVAEYFDESNKTLLLKNLVSQELDVIKISDISNVELFLLDTYEESLSRVTDIICKKIQPMLSEPYSNLSQEVVNSLIFLDGMNVNYMRIMDFMNYTSPEDFKSINFERLRYAGVLTDEIREDAYLKFSLIVNKKMESVIFDISKKLGDDAIPIVDDIRSNVSEFLVEMRKVNPSKLQNHWPTLINPSPYYFQPRVVTNDG